MKPAIFNTAMVRAILALIKKNTRRPFSKYLKKVIDAAYAMGEIGSNGIDSDFDDSDKKYLMSFAPYQVGDIIYVRETWNHTANESDLLDHEPRNKIGGRFIVYRADGEQIHPIHGKSIWKPSIHMPKEYARLFLRVKDVRIERLNEISEDDAIKEGINRISGDEGSNYNPEYYHGELLAFKNKHWHTPKFFDSAHKAFWNLWESIYGKDSFDNRYVWVIEFEPISKEEAING